MRHPQTGLLRLLKQAINPPAEPDTPRPPADTSRRAFIRQLTLAQFDTYLAGCDAVFPGMKQAANGRKSLYNWSRNPLTRGSYSCYRVGQLTALGQAESERVGNLLFAGEHCSSQFQGFMNGAAETGRQAAESIAKTVGMAVRPVAQRTHQPV